MLSGWDSFETEVIHRHLLTVFNQKQPAVIRMRLTTDRDQLVAAEMIALPVIMRGSERVQIVGGLFPFRDARALGHNAIAKQELVSGRVIWTEHLVDRVPANQSFIPERLAERQFTVIAGGKA